MSDVKYELVLSDPANKYYQRVDRKMAHRLNQCFADLETNPFDFKNYDLKPLHGKYVGELRLRLGALRLIYEVDKANRIVYLIAIRPRGQAY